MGFVGLLAYTVSYSVENNHINLFLSGVDVDGKSCGVTPGFEDFSAVYYMAIPETDPSTQEITYTLNAVCVKECPAEETDIVNCKSDSIICPSTPIDPDQPSLGGHVGYGTFDIFDKYCFPDIDKMPAEIKDDYEKIIGDFGVDDMQKFVDQMAQIKLIFLYSALSFFGVAFIYYMIIRCCASLLIIISIIFSALAMAGMALFMQGYHDDHYADAKNTSQAKALQTGIYCIYGFVGLYLLCILCMCKNIQRSINVMQTAAAVVTGNLRMWLIPLISTIVVCCYLIAWIAMFCTLLSCAEITVKPNSQLKEVSFTGKDEIIWMLIVQAVGLIWITCLLMDIFNYTLIVGVCNWYFTSTSERRGTVTLCNGICWAFTRNLGSLAMGSATITMTWLVRFAVGWFFKRLGESDSENCIVRCLACVCTCCIDCCQRCINYIENRAYVQVALEGKNFCSAAGQALTLNKRHAADYVVIDGMGMLLEFLAKVTIAIGNAGVGYLMLTEVDQFKNKTDNPWLPILVIFIISYVMAVMFMSIFSVTSMTLLQCLYVDFDFVKHKGLY